MLGLGEQYRGQPLNFVLDTDIHTHTLHFNLCVHTEIIAVELQLANLLDVNLNFTGVSLIWNMEEGQDNHKVTHITLT